MPLLTPKRPLAFELTHGIRSSFKKQKIHTMTQLHNKRTAPTAVQLFDELFQEFPAFWGRDMKNAASNPATNIYETKDGFHIELMAPGRAKEDFQIDLDKNMLTIRFEKKESSEQTDLKTVRREFAIESFKRSFTLGEKVNIDGIQAKYENGLLSLWLPKQEVTNSVKQINIQ
jgi:HSP20 family protein